MKGKSFFFSFLEFFLSLAFNVVIHWHSFIISCLINSCIHIFFVSVVTIIDIISGFDAAITFADTVIVLEHSALLTRFEANISNHVAVVAADTVVISKRTCLALLAKFEAAICNPVPDNVAKLY